LPRFRDFVLSLYFSVIDTNGRETMRRKLVLNDLVLVHDLIHTPDSVVVPRTPPYWLYPDVIADYRLIETFQIVAGCRYVQPVNALVVMVCAVS
jgi:hypothetical protein